VGNRWKEEVCLPELPHKKEGDPQGEIVELHKVIAERLKAWTGTPKEVQHLSPPQQTLLSKHRLLEEVLLPTLTRALVTVPNASLPRPPSSNPTRERHHIYIRPHLFEQQITNEQTVLLLLLLLLLLLFQI
jgi:hypothetical protein